MPRLKHVAPKTKVVLFLPPESAEQLKKLSEVFNVLPASIVAQAIARWFHTEPLVKKNHGTNHSGVSG